MAEINEFHTNSSIMSVDEEQLKVLAGIMRKHASDLDRIKKQSNAIWEQCSEYLDDSVIKNINSIKEINEKKYIKAMEDLNSYADKMESIANIWKDTETEIKASSKRLETLFSDISKTMNDAINSAINKINNSNNN